MSAGKALKELINKDGYVVTAGAYDAWSSKLIELSGFPCIIMSGYGVSASTLGKPDIGLVTLNEMSNQLRNITHAVNIPVIADGDNGYGGLLNVIRTVELYEQAGAAAILLEDQAIPKRCGHMEGKEVIPKNEMVSKINAAKKARKDPDFIIIGRTDARGVNGFDDALDRAIAYEKAGADIIFLEAPQSVEEMKEIHKYIKVPTLANMVEKGKTPLLNGADLARIGYKIIIYPVSSLYCVTKAILDMLNIIKEKDTTKFDLDKMIPFDIFNELISLDEFRRLEKSLFWK